jgi:hypothetical protein
MLILFLLFVSKKYENLCPVHERPSFGLSVGYSIYMANLVLEYFVRRVVTNISLYQLSEPLKTAKTPSESAVLTANRGNAMIM